MCTYIYIEYFWKDAPKLVTAGLPGLSRGQENWIKGIRGSMNIISAQL